MITTKAFREAFERRMLLTLKALFENLDKFSDATTIINHPKDAIQMQATTELDLQSDGLKLICCNRVGGGETLLENYRFGG